MAMTVIATANAISLSSEQQQFKLQKAQSPRLQWRDSPLACGSFVHTTAGAKHQSAVYGSALFRMRKTTRAPFAPFTALSIFALIDPIIDILQPLSRGKGHAGIVAAVFCYRVTFTQHRPYSYACFLDRQLLVLCRVFGRIAWH